MLQFEQKKSTHSITLKYVIAGKLASGFDLVVIRDIFYKVNIFQELMAMNIVLFKS